MREIKVLGSGCAKCEQLAALAESAARDMAIEYTLEKVTDLKEILNFGVFITPALVVDGEVRSSGNLPTIEEIKSMLSTKKQ